MNAMSSRRLVVFVVLVALVVGAALAGRSTRDARLSSRLTEPGGNTPAFPLVPTADDADGALPSASPSGAASTTWYCIGGSGAADGPAPATLELASKGATLTATVTSYGSDGSSTRREVQVPAAGRTDLAVASLSKAPSVAVVAEAPGGDLVVDQRFASPLGADRSSCASQASSQWDFADGSTDRGAVEQLVLFNPFATEATADVALMLADGLRRPSAFQGIPVPAHTVSVLQVSDVENRRPALAASVTTRVGQLVVARVQSFDGTGPAGPTGSPPKGLSVGLGSAWAATSFVIPTGMFTDGESERVVIANPGSADSTVRLDFVVDRPDVNGQPTPLTVTVPANSTTAVGAQQLRQLPPGVTFAVRGHVTSGGPVVAELWRYVAPTDASKVSGVGAIGASTVAASSWVVPIAGGGARSDRLTVVSAGRSARLTLEVVNGGRVTTVAVPPPAGAVSAGGLVSIDLATLLPDAPGATLVVTATQPVVVARTLTGPDVGVPSALGAPVRGTVALLP